jgi:hypothetical protein
VESKGNPENKKRAPHGAIETILPILLGLTTEHQAQTANGKGLKQRIASRVSKGLPFRYSHSARADTGNCCQLLWLKSILFFSHFNFVLKTVDFREYSPAVAESHYLPLFVNY